MQKEKIFLGGDHAGFALKKALLESLTKEFPEIDFEDCGTRSEDSVDYPEYSKRVAQKVVTAQSRGILVCGSGIGVSIAANKVRGVRAAVCTDVTAARLCREHNDANILCLGSRLIGSEVALDICRIWLKTPFSGGRHQKRIDLITKLEQEL